MTSSVVKGIKVTLQRVRGIGLLLGNKALYESDMSCGKNNCPRRVFFLSGYILGCAINFVDCAQCKYKP